LDNRGIMTVTFSLTLGLVVFLNHGGDLFSLQKSRRISVRFYKEPLYLYCRGRARVKIGARELRVQKSTIDLGKLLLCDRAPR